MSRIVGILLLLLILCACNKNPKPADTTLLTKAEFELSGMEVTLFLPSEAIIKPIPNSDAVTIEFRPNTRSPFRISLAKSINTSLSLNDNSKHSHTVSLINGATLNYDNATSSGGSGGTEAFLEGHIDFETNRIEVNCHSQQEWPKPDARWCVPYLHHLIIYSE